jgi:MFS family permease
VIAMAIFCLADRVATLTLARFVQGIGGAFLWLSAHTIVADAASASGRGRDFGSINEATNRGAILGTTGGFVVIVTLSGFGLDWSIIWFWLFAGYGLMALFALWTAWQGVHETLPAAALQPVESQPMSGQLLALMAIVFATGASSAMVWPLLMVFLQDSLGASVTELTWAYLPAAVIGAFLPSRMGRLADRVGRKPPMVAGLIVGALASVLMPHLGSILLLAALWAVESLSYTASVPAERAFVADIAGEDTRGASYGMYTFAFFLGAVVGPLVGGWVYDNLGKATPFYLNTLVLLLGALLVATVLREPESTAAAQVAQAGRT